MLIMKNEKFIDMRTAPRKLVESALLNSRDMLMIEYFQLRIDIESYNESRFPDNPIIIDLNNLEGQYELFKQRPMEEQNRIMALLFKD